MAAEHAGQDAPHPDFESEQLPPGTLFQAERMVQTPGGIADPVQTAEAVPCQEFLDPGPVTHMNEHDSRAAPFDFLPRLRDVGDGFTAESASGVAQEHQ